MFFTIVSTAVPEHMFLTLKTHTDKKHNCVILYQGNRIIIKKKLYTYPTSNTN